MSRLRPRPGPPRPDIPLRSAVRDRSTGWVGVLISYGTHAARVKFYADKPTQWVKFYNLEAVSEEELAAIVQAEREKRAQTEDLV